MIDFNMIGIAAGAIITAYVVGRIYSTGSIIVKEKKQRSSVASAN